MQAQQPARQHAATAPALPSSALRANERGAGTFPSSGCPHFSTVTKTELKRCFIVNVLLRGGRKRPHFFYPTSTPKQRRSACHGVLVRAPFPHGPISHRSVSVRLPAPLSRTRTGNRAAPPPLALSTAAQRSARGPARAGRVRARGQAGNGPRGLPRPRGASAPPAPAPPGAAGPGAPHSVTATPGRCRRAALPSGSAG